MKKTLSRTLAAVAFLGVAIASVGWALAHPLAAGVEPLSIGNGVALIGLGGLIVNSENLSAIYKGFKALYAQAFAGAPRQFERIATVVPSSTKTEDYGWLGQFPKLREWIGDRHIKNLAAHGYSITNKKFESSIGIPRDDIEDDRYGVFSPLFSEMGYAAATHPDELVFALLALGTSELCFDGQYFFDTDHPVGEGTVSNTAGGASTAWYLLDTSRPLKPLIFQKRREYDLKAMVDPKDEAVFMRDEYRYGVDARCNVGFGFWQMAYHSKQTLDATNYGAARTAMMSVKSDEGRPLGVSPKLLVVPPSLEKAALDVVQAERLANGATNTYRNTAEVMVVPWLA